MNHFRNLLFFISFCFSLSTQDNRIIIGSKIKVKSNIMNETREIHVYLPENFSSEKEYPTMYVLDGDRYALNGLIYQKNLLFQDASPEFIVVGIPISKQERNSVLVNKPLPFITFITKELKNYIKKNFNGRGENILFGWERGGRLAIEIFTKYTDEFNGYIISSPTMLREVVLNNFFNRIEKPFKRNIYFNFGIDKVETWSTAETNKISEKLANVSSDKLIWSYHLLENEDHYSTPTKIIHNGLKSIFHDYQALRFYSMSEFIKFGGITELKRHYELRGKRYNISKEVHPGTKHYLFLQAWKEDNIQIFIQLKNIFPAFLTSFNRALWFNRYATFMNKHGFSKEAKKIISLGITKFPKSEELKKVLITLSKK